MKTLCTIRDIYRSIRDFESLFQRKYDLCLNEGMLLCSLRNQTLSSSELADVLGLSNSNTSKVIKSVEDKELIERILGKEDKRQMYFQLTGTGKKKLAEIKKAECQINDLIDRIGSIATMTADVDHQI